jgi:Dolichyl-phosphate-mannose-protein mannosyltransferase
VKFINAVRLIFVNDSKSIACILAVLLIAVVGISLALQGWRSRLPSFDALVDIDNAHEFIVNRHIPDHGVLTSLVSHSPPGIAWLTVPGELLFRDPRLFQYVGSVAVYLGTLIGIFLLANMYFGPQCAVLSVAVYGLSELGLTVASSLWQRYPIHLFYVWMVYFAGYWVRTKQAKHLAAAIAVWGTGMYVFMEFAPAVFILPVIWIYYRPPVQIRPLLIAGILIGVVWYPYLRFEVNRDFVDLKSQVFRQYILPTSFEESWCDPNLAPPSWNAEANQGSDSAGSLWPQIRHFAFDRGTLILGVLSIPSISLLLLLLKTISLSLLSTQFFTRFKGEGIDRQVRWANQLKWLSAAMILCGLLMNEFTIARYLTLDRILEPSTVSMVRQLQALVIVAGIALMILRHAMAAGLNSLTRDPHSKDDNHSDDARVLLISLIIPLLILLYLAEADAPRRFWWLSPVQSVILASLVYWLMKLSAPRLLISIGSAVLVVLVASNSLVISRINSWIANGWSGVDLEQLKLVDYAAKQIKSDGRDHAAIGYDLFIDNYWALFNVADHRYKVGADLDLFFKYRYGIVNTSRCAEGVSSQDSYRIKQSRVLKFEEHQHLDIPQDDRFHALKKLDEFQLLQRSTE